MMTFHGFAHVVDLKNMVRLWNKALTVFYSGGRLACVYAYVA